MESSVADLVTDWAGLDVVTTIAVLDADVWTDVFRAEGTLDLPYLPDDPGDGLSFTMGRVRLDDIVINGAFVSFDLAASGASKPSFSADLALLPVREMPNVAVADGMATVETALADGTRVRCTLERAGS